jgi:hypothetical protein
MFIGVLLLLEEAVRTWNRKGIKTLEQLVMVFFF